MNGFTAEKIIRVVREINYRKMGYILAAGTVAGVAAYASYGHMHDVAQIAHQADALAKILPLSVDGMLVVATLAMAEDKANGRRPRGWARVAFWLGALVSVAANVASTMVHFGWDWLAIGVAGWAPIALLIVTEIMARPGKVVAEDVEDATDAKPTATMTAAEKRDEKDARKRAGYAKKDRAGKAAWTKQYRERLAKRNAATAPTSPGHGPVPNAPSAADLEAMVG